MKTDLQRYSAAMIAGSHATCVAIEQKHDLFGYPPELVCAGLRGVEQGICPHRAIDEYLNDAE